MDHLKKCQVVGDTLDYYAEQIDGESDNKEVVVVDFLADLLHYCRQERMDFDQLAAVAKVHYRCDRS